MRISGLFQFVVLPSVLLGALGAQGEECCSPAGLQKGLNAVNAVVSDYSDSAELFALVANDFQRDETAMKLKFEASGAPEIEKLLGPDYKPSESAGIFLLFRQPTDFRLDHQPKGSVSVDASQSNTLVHPQRLGRDGRSSYFEADGVGQTLSVKATSKVDSETEVGVGLRFLRLSGGGSLVAYPVSDRFIESAHRRMGYTNPYEARGENLIFMDMRDFNGNRLEVKEPKDFVLPIVFDLNRFRTLLELESAKTTFKGGLHLGVPLDKNFGQLSFGADCVLVHTRAVTRNYLISMAGGIALQAQRNIFGGYQPTPGTDVSHHEMVSFAITRMDSNQEGKTSLITSVTQNSAFVSGDYRQSSSQRRWVDRQAADALTTPDRRLEVAVVRETKDWTVRGGVTEDLVGRKGYRMNGLNHEDFKVFISASRKF